MAHMFDDKICSIVILLYIGKILISFVTIMVVTTFNCPRLYSNINCSVSLEWLKLQQMVLNYVNFVTISLCIYNEKDILVE